jgi:hypothetical protein
MCRRKANQELELDEARKVIEIQGMLSALSGGSQPRTRLAGASKHGGRQRLHRASRVGA